MSRKSRNPSKSGKPARSGKSHKSGKSAKVRKSTDHDPHARREAQKYDNPIPSREFIMDLLEKAEQPLNRDQIASALGIKGPEQFEALRRRLRAMERDGQLIFTRKREYGLVRKMDLIRGRVIGHPDGFGFLQPEEGGDDLFMSAREMHGVIHGDRVVVSVAGVDRRGRREAVVVEVLERAHAHLVGRLFVEGGVATLTPDNKRINHDVLIPNENLNNAKHGQIVSVEITQQPSRFRQPIGRVDEILGEHMAPGMEIDIAIRSHDLPQVWPEAVEDEIAGYTPEVSEADKDGREDIRQLPLVTIDGEDARDFDDAVYCEPNKDGWRLLVAIADVSHYVQPNSALDKEALSRGNSVYFPERVIPMLPEILSNGLCSLNPKTDRLCMVCDMQLDQRGALKQSRFYPAVMYSHARLTYTKVAAMLVDGDQELRTEYEPVLPHLENLRSLFDVMLKRRKKRGAIDFDTTETRIVFGDDRKIEKIVPLFRNDAHRMIEEFMIMANVATAHFLLKNKIAGLYRIHEGPKEAKLEALREFLGEFGLNLPGGEKPKAEDYARLLNEIHDRPDVHLIQTVMLRSLRQAVYSPDNVGHFGLAFDAYSHFTSPIRRYPDLLVHRAIRHLVENNKAKDFIYSHEKMANFGDHCSQTERRADEATRDAVDWLKCEHMMDKIGEDFDGTISSVTSFGLFVELDEVYVEGLIHVTSLDKDYFHFEPARHRLLGERTRKSYRLGDRIRIKVARVSLDDRKIDFDIVGEASVNPTVHRAIEPVAETDKGSKQNKRRKNRKNKSDKKKEPAMEVVANTETKKVSKKKTISKKKVVKKKIAKKTTGKKVSKKKAVNKKTAKKKVAQTPVRKKIAKKKVAGKTTGKKVAKKTPARKKVTKKKVAKKTAAKKVARKKVTKKKVARKKVVKKKTVRKKR
ncbi:MAG: ribonuclease R [Gammaproteobacteria bacterium]|nr:ribonuclease R [Gammaproteobacteria bacterium]